MSHSPACLCKVPGQIGPDETCVCPAVSALVADAYRRGRADGKATVHNCGEHSAACCSASYQRGYTAGYNDHAEAAQHWQDTHGAYRQRGQGENP